MKHHYPIVLHNCTDSGSGASRLAKEGMSWKGKFWWNYSEWNQILYRCAKAKTHSNLTNSPAQRAVQTVVPVALSKHTRKDFQVITCFWSQRNYCITIALSSCEHGAEKIGSLSNNQQIWTVHQRELCLSKSTFTYKIDADNHLCNCVCGALSIEIDIVNICLRNHCGKER